MLDAGVPAELTEALIDRYRPAFVLQSGDGETPAVRRGPPGRGPRAR